MSHNQLRAERVLLGYATIHAELRRVLGTLELRICDKEVVKVVYDLQLRRIGVLGRDGIAVLMPLTRSLGTSIDISKDVV